MVEKEPKLTTPVTLVVDAILVIVFFFYMYWVCWSHVPSNETKWKLIWGGATAALFAALFWLALQMFRVVLRFQRKGHVGVEE